MGQLSDLLQGYSQANLGAQEDIAKQLKGFSQGSIVQGFLGEGLTAAEQMQLNAIGTGREQAMQGIEQTTRAEATSRGLFSSRGAIQDEAANLAQIPLYEAQQRANIYAQAQNRQFQGAGLYQGILGNSSNIYGQVSQGFQGIAGQRIQQEQYADQLHMQQQEQLSKNVLGAGALIAAPFTGGASLAAAGSTGSTGSRLGLSSLSLL